MKKYVPIHSLKLVDLIHSSGNPNSDKVISSPLSLESSLQLYVRVRSKALGISIHWRKRKWQITSQTISTSLLEKTVITPSSTVSAGLQVNLFISDYVVVWCLYISLVGWRCEDSPTVFLGIYFTFLDQLANCSYEDYGSLRTLSLWLCHRRPHKHFWFTNNDLTYLLLGSTTLGVFWPAKLSGRIDFHGLENCPDVILSSQSWSS